MPSLPVAPKIESFEAVSKEEEEELCNRPVTIKIDVRSISSFVKDQPFTIENIWDKFRHDDMKEETSLQGDILNSFLHEILKKWYEFHSPKEGSKLVQAQTSSAVVELKQLIRSSSGQANEENLERWTLSKKTLMLFVEEMKKREFGHEELSAPKKIEIFSGKVYEISDSGLAIPSSRRGISILHQKFKKPLMAKKGIDVLYQNFRNRLIEPPIQKYQRLKSGIERFEDLLRLFADQKLSTNTRSGRPIISGVEQELLKLSELTSDKFGPEQSRPSGLAANDVLPANLSSFQESKSNQGVAEASLFFLFSKAGLVEEQPWKIKILDDQLVQLEKKLGETSEAIHTKDFLPLIDFLSTQLNVLGDPAEIQALEQQVKKLEEELAKIEPNSQTFSKRLEPNLARQRIENVEKMIEMMSVWDKAAAQLPNVIDRLNQLQQLNIEASGLVQWVSTLPTQQTTSSEMPEKDRVLLQRVFKRLVSKTEKDKKMTLEQRLLKVKRSWYERIKRHLMPSENT